MMNSILIIFSAALILSAVALDSPMLGLFAGIASVFTGAVAARNIDKETDR